MIFYMYKKGRTPIRQQLLKTTQLFSSLEASIAC